VSNVSIIEYTVAGHFNDLRDELDALDAATVTLTNKTLALWSNTVSGTKAQYDTSVTDDNFAYLGTAQEYTATQSFNATTLTDWATISRNASLNQVCKVTLGGNRTMAAPTNLVDWATYILRIIQDGTWTRTITRNWVFKWAWWDAPTLTTTAWGIDIVSFVSDGTNMYWVTSLAFS